MPKLTQDQVNFAVSCVSEWMRICEDVGRGVGSPDVDHSALLPYMLAGNAPFENPPPKSHSCPNYKLAAGEKCYVHLHIREPGLYQHGVSVDQDPNWSLELSPLPLMGDGGRQGLIKHTTTEDLYKFEEATAEQAFDTMIGRPDISREDHIASIQKQINKYGEEGILQGILQGFLQRVDGEATRKEMPKWFKES